MCTGKDDDFCPEETDEPAAITPAQAIETPEESHLHRRAFLKAAAIGTAVAALAGKGASFGPLSAYAHDMSSSQCTANDVRIVGGLGQIVHQPCNCPPGTTFTAEVQFVVHNQAASPRGCVTLHLAGGPFEVPDILLNNGDPIPGQTTVTMTGFIENFPCGISEVCFGLEGEEIRGRCAAPCSTVSWTVPGQDTCPPTRFIASKCRHQQICIRGRGIATLDCDIATAGIQTNCPVECGTTKIVELCTTSGALAFGPFTFTLSDGQTATGAAGETCHQFTVGPITADTTLTGTVTDNTDCVLTSNEVTLTTAPVDTPLVSAGAPDCAGTVEYTVTNCDSSLTYTWFEADCTTGAPIGDSIGTGCTLTHTWPQDGLEHCVVVTASNGQTACDETSAVNHVTIPTPVTLILEDFVTDCTGVVTFTASASGGVPPYTFRWTVDDIVQSETGPVFVVGPFGDLACHKIQVAVEDSQPCPGDGARTVHITQCIETSACTPPA